MLEFEEEKEKRRKEKVKRLKERIERLEIVALEKKKRND